MSPPCCGSFPGKSAGSGTAEIRNFIDLRKIQPVRRHCAPESSFASASGRPAGKACHQNHAHPDDQDGPRDRGALKLRGCCGRRTGGGQAQGPHHPEAGCRAGQSYIESCFGRSLYPPERLRKAEQELCVGDHLGCHLWFSAGVPSPEQAPTPEAKHLAEQAELQADRNRAYYAKIGNCTAVWCCGLPSRSATASLCTSSPTPVLPAAAT